MAETEEGAVVGLTPAEAAVADAVALLSGPALDLPSERSSPEAVEATWGDDVRRGLDALRTDLDGKRLGLAISGGGALGSFEAGALRFLYDHARVAPAAISGNSSGALNAAKLAHGAAPSQEAPIDGLERLWRSMRTNPDMWEPEPWLERVVASAQWASAIRGQVHGSSSATNAMRIAARVVSSLVRRPEETDGTVDAIKDALAAQSLLSLRPVAAIIAAELDEATVASSGIALRMGTVSLEAGELRYVTETGAIHDRNDRPTGQPRVPVADGILASASIPIAFPPVLLNDEHYVDGGAREILPLEVLVSHLEVERAVAVSASSVNIHRSADFADRNVVDILRRVSAEIAPNETLRKELSPPGGWGPTVRLVVPELDVHDSMTIDPALIAISFDYGWMRAADRLCGLDGRIAVLADEITQTRMELRRRAGPLPSMFGVDPGHEVGPEPAWEDGPETLTARFREQALARRDAGGPVPASIAAWLDAD